MATKLLVMGMPLRGIVEMLEVKLHTVRHWLRLAAEQCKKIALLLLSELKVSQVELDVLWPFVKNGPESDHLEGEVLVRLPLLKNIG